MSYPIQRSDYLIGSASSDATLTAAYSGNQNTILTKGYERTTLLIKYTPAITDRICTIQVEGSDEQAQFYNFSALVETTTDGISENKVDLFTITGSAGVAETRRYIFDVSDFYFRVSAKEDGSSSFGTVHVKIIRSE